MNMNKIYLDVTNDKRFIEWAKAMKKKINKNPSALDHFEQNFAVVRNGMFLPRASFVMYWEMFNSDNLARSAEKKEIGDDSYATSSDGAG